MSGMHSPTADALDFDPMGNRAQRFQLGSWVVVPARGLIRSNGVERRLTPQQMEVLICLARRPGEVVSKSELLDEVWNGAIVEEGALARSVSELRATLADDARAPKYIQTVSGQGYRLITEPIAVDGSESDHSVDDDNGVTRRRRPWPALVAVSLLAVAAITFYTGYRSAWMGERSAALDGVTEVGLAAPAGPTVAVLGFRNLSSDPATDWLSTAMPELLANELAISSEVRVVPAQSVSRMTQELPIPEGETLALETLAQVAAVLGADFVVLGSYLRLPGQISREVRLDARVQDAETAEVITTWSETVSDPEVLSSLSRAGVFLRQALGVHGSSGVGPEVAAYLPKDPTALRLYFQGVRALRRFEATAARDLLTRSLALEPNQPFALLALSQAWATLGYDARAVEVARTALEQSEGLPREHRLLVEASFFAVSSKWTEAIERYRALWLLAPENLDYAVLLARSQNSAGLPEKALSTLERIGSEAGPETDPRVSLMIAESAARTGDHERALGAARSAADRAAVLGSGLMLARARQSQAIALHRLGQVREASAALEEARTAFAEAGDFASEARILAMKADWLIKQGNLEEAHGRLADALESFQLVGDLGGEAEALSRLGQVLSYRGDLAGARERLTRAVSTFVELEDRFGQATALGELAYALGSSGQPNEAEPLLREAAQIFRGIGAHEQAAATDSVLGMTLFVVARPAEGHLLLKRAEQSFETLGSKHELGMVWRRLASSYWCLGDLDEAENNARRALRVGAEVENPRIRGFALVELSRVLKERAKMEDGIAAAEQALEIARALELPVLHVAALARLSEVLLAKGELDAALVHSRSAVERAKTSKKFVVGTYDILARVLMAANRLDAAARVVAEAAGFDDGFSDVSMELGLTASRLEMRAAGATGSRKRIQEIEEASHRGGHWVLEMDARLARGELEGRLGNLSQAQEILLQVEKEAGARGWSLRAREARIVRRLLSEASS